MPKSKIIAGYVMVAIHHPVGKFGQHLKFSEQKLMGFQTLIMGFGPLEECGKGIKIGLFLEWGTSFLLTRPLMGGTLIFYEKHFTLAVQKAGG
jgi:hypothetical protein